MIDSTDRNQRCGATDVAVMLGLAPKKTARELWLEKRGMLDPWKGNEATRGGTRLEPSVLDEAQSRLGPLNRNVPVFAPNAGFPLAAQLDAHVIDSGEPVDAKTSGIVGPVYGDWGDEGTDQIPQYYLVQILVQAYCAEQAFERQIERAHLMALLGGRGFVAYEAVHDRELVAEIVARARDWWQRHIVDGVEPDPSQPIPLDVAKRLTRQPNKVIDWDERGQAAVDRWQSAKEAAKVANAAVDAAQADLLLLLADAEAARLNDGRMFTYMEQSRKGYQVAPCTYRTPRIKTGGK